MANKKHGMDGTKIYRVWGRMKERCTRENHKSYKDYGGRGIKVCEEWKEFIPFWEWAKENGYEEGLTLERLNVNGNYEPSNCKWITMKEQQRNKRNNRFVIINGEEKTLAEWAEIAGISPKVLRYRVESDWDEKDLLKKEYKAKLLEVNGVKKTAKEWAEEYDLTPAIILNRYKSGKRNEELIKKKR